MNSYGSFASHLPSVLGLFATFALLVFSIVRSPRAARPPCGTRGHGPRPRTTPQCGEPRADLSRSR